jgi:hypothetical protein
MIINYKVNKNDEGLTPCPNQKNSVKQKTMVGSQACSDCESFGGHLVLNETLYCNFGKTGKKKQTNTEHIKLTLNNILETKIKEYNIKYNQLYPTEPVKSLKALEIEQRQYKKKIQLIGHIISDLKWMYKPDREAVVNAILKKDEISKTEPFNQKAFVKAAEKLFDYTMFGTTVLDYIESLTDQLTELRIKLSKGRVKITALLSDMKGDKETINQIVQALYNLNKEAK